jgi:rubrerythrin
MADKPSYLGLLNAISCAETRAHCYLTAWAEVTPDPDVRKVLLTVAAREGEHGMAFAKRINELGFELIPTDDPGFDDRLEAVRSRDKSDLEKLEAIGLLNFCVDDGEPDVFDNFFRDHSIDIQTGELLGRYIAEERDTLRLVAGCASTLQSRANGGEAAAATSDQLAGLENKVDAVCRAVEELRQIVCAQAMPAEALNEARPSKSNRSRRP